MIRDKYIVVPCRINCIAMKSLNGVPINIKARIKTTTKYNIYFNLIPPIEFSNPLDKERIVFSSLQGCCYMIELDNLN
jgi:hypothetical protein